MMVKEEIVDDSYDQWNKRRLDDEDEALMIAKRIKQEFESSAAAAAGAVALVRENSPPETAPQRRAPVDRLIEPRVFTAPLVFDHFICLRIGLNSTNNAQKLMALLGTHNFVDLTVIPTPTIVTNVPVQVAQSVLREPVELQKARVPNCAPSTSKVPNTKPNGRGYWKMTRYASKTAYDPSGSISTPLRCSKCSLNMPAGSTHNSLLNHVQKNHLKMAAFQCRICKQYRTTQERIQSHVTTVHKARSSKFDDSLAGPLSQKDIEQMEAMIHRCFPQVKVALEITDRLSVKTCTSVPDGKDDQ